MRTLCLRERKQEMRLSVSMMQAFPCSYFLEEIMNSSRLGTTACQARKTVERQHKQQLGKDRLWRLPALDRWREEREQGEIRQRWRSSVNPRKSDEKRSNGKWEFKERCGNDVTLMHCHIWWSKGWATRFYTVIQKPNQWWNGEENHVWRACGICAMKQR